MVQITPSQQHTNTMKIIHEVENRILLMPRTFILDNFFIILNQSTCMATKLSTLGIFKMIFILLSETYKKN